MTKETSLDLEVRVTEDARVQYRAFIDRCRAPDGLYRLTPRADSSPYALCFAIFGLHLLQEREQLQLNAGHWDELLRSALRTFKLEREAKTQLGRDKAFLQLLTFVLSALHVLGTLRADALGEEVSSLLPSDLENELQCAGALHGKPRSGNQAMFLAILLIHARDYLHINTQSLIDRWVELHLSRMNAFGFWGQAPTITHLQFQNGYHQYEILDYLRTPGVPWHTAADNVAILADCEGHFAPYPGGGGCYDYDAVFILTSGNPGRHRDLLIRSFQSISSEQNFDGGFCESCSVRPRSWKNMRRTLRHITAAQGAAFKERLRWSLALVRPKHDRIQTHWSTYSRQWGESDLWDSWFRMLTLARIEVALDTTKANRWGFIDYPGIGFHNTVREGVDQG